MASVYDDNRGQVENLWNNGKKDKQKRCQNKKNLTLVGFFRDVTSYEQVTRTLAKEVCCE